MINFSFYICDTLGFLRVMLLVRTLLTIIRFIVPLLLILWIAKDLFTKVINPDDKEGLKKIEIRVLAAVIIFLIPSLVSGILKLVDFINPADTNYKSSSCYNNATSECIDTIKSYLNCDDVSGNDKDTCKEFRSCNSYHLSENCSISTELNDNQCLSINQSSGNRYFVNNFRK